MQRLQNYAALRIQLSPRRIAEPNKRTLSPQRSALLWTSLYWVNEYYLSKIQGNYLFIFNLILTVFATKGALWLFVAFVDMTLDNCLICKAPNHRLLQQKKAQIWLPVLQAYRSIQSCSHLCLWENLECVHWECTALTLRRRIPVQAA